MKKDNPTKRKVKDLVKPRLKNKAILDGKEVTLSDMESLCSYYRARRGNCIHAVFTSIVEEEDLLF